MKLYLAGPMSGIAEHNFPAFFKATAQLEAAGYEVVNPATLNDLSKNPTWEDCLKNDIRHLLDCDGIALLPGWEKSRGATLEHHIAERVGIRASSVAMWLKFSGFENRKVRRRVIQQGEITS